MILVNIVLMGVNMWSFTVVKQTLPSLIVHVKNTGILLTAEYGVKSRNIERNL